MIKKILLKFLLVPALLLGGATFYTYSKTGKILFVDKGALTELMGSGGSGSSTADLRAKITNKANINTSKDKQTFYKWKDENGRWHYGTTPPENVQTKSVDYNPTSNVVASVKIPVKEEKTSSGSSSQSSGSEITGSASDALNPNKILKTINDAQNMQQTIDDAYAKQQEQIRNLR